MKLKKITSLALSFLFLLPALSLMSACGSRKTVTLRVYNWEEYIDEGGRGSFIYDELHDTDEAGNIIEIKSDLIDDDYIARYETETGSTFHNEGAHIIDDFELWYENTYNVPVKVEYSTFGTNEDLYNQLKLGNTYDLVCPSDYMIMKLAAEGMLEPFDESFFDKEDEKNYYINNLSPYIANVFDTGELTVGDEIKHWSDYAAGYMWGTTGLVYNPDFVSEEDLEEGWAIMLNPTYQKKVTTKDNVRDTYFIGLAICYQDELLELKTQYENGSISAEEYNAAVTAIMNRTDEESVEKVLEILLEMKKNIFGFETDTGKSDMVKGTIYLNFAWSGDAVYALDLAEEDDVYLNYYIPEEGANLWFDGWVIPKDDNRDAATKHAAQAFINFMSKPESAVRNMYYIGYSSVIASEEVFDYVAYTYEAEDDAEDVIDYDLSYFFGEDAIISADAEQLRRQLYAQYPSEEVIYRCAVMDYYGEDDARINELWTKVKGETLDAWAIIVICVAVVLIILFVLYVKLFNKIDLFRPKPKKGYERIKQEPIR